MHVEEIARLHLRDGGHVTAASGLVRHDDRLWVVSDDTYLLSWFPEDLSAPGESIALSDEVVTGKADKPDLEALTVMPDGSLLTIGSGSTDRRERGFRYDIGSGRVEVLDLARLYRELRATLPDLNIEGLAAMDDRLWLAQRGNGASAIDAIVEVDLDLREIHEVHVLDLGEGLNFSDLSPLGDGRLVFAAAREETGGSTYHDGETTAAAFGILDVHTREVLETHLLPHPHKIEGIVPGYLMVVDPDDDAEPAPLLRATVD